MNFPTIQDAELTSVIRLSNFSQMVPDKELLAGKGWTRPMVALLGAPHRQTRKDGQTMSLWKQAHVIAVMQTDEFRKELLSLLASKATTKFIIDEALLLAACNAMYDINKHIKTKVYGYSYANRAYKLKYFLLQYLYANNYVTEVVYEVDTDLYRLTITIQGQTFIWHQPKNQAEKFIKSFVPVRSYNPDQDAEITSPDAYGLLDYVTDIVLSILLAELNTSVVA